MEPEERIDELERKVTTLIEALAALVGGEQAMLFGLQASIAEKDPQRAIAELRRNLAAHEAYLQGSPISDDWLDQIAPARERIASTIETAFLRASLTDEERDSLRERPSGV